MDRRRTAGRALPLGANATLEVASTKCISSAATIRPASDDQAQRGDANTAVLLAMNWTGAWQASSKYGA